MVGAETSTPDSRVLTSVIRAVLLVLVIVLCLLAGNGFRHAGWWILLGLAGAVGILAPPALRASDLTSPTSTWIGRFGRIAEVVVAVLASVPAMGLPGRTLPYLVAVTFAAGLATGALEVLALVLGAAVLVVLTGSGIPVIGGDVLTDSDYLGIAVGSLVTALLAGIAANWIRQLVTERTVTAEPEYAQATRLLTQLRTIARQLPGTLDPRSIAERLLDELRTEAAVVRGAVFTGGGGGRLEVLAESGPDRVDWETSLDADTPIAEAWASQQPQIAASSLARSGKSGQRVSAAVLPLVTGVRTVGLVVLEADGPGAYPQPVLNALVETANQNALRLETALLFDDVRSLATVEERQRLAREIHDGVAQELVMVGYGIDNAIAELPVDAESAADGLRSLRAEVTRVITELRLSLFELRSDVDRHGGLSSAIAEYARTVGASAGLRVHWSMDESTARLPAAIESELLRIAQEAMTNARKHANATNLWVSCEIDPPYARLEVSDDGRGMGSVAGDSSFGMAIMAERAERIRAELSIVAREPTGTTVCVVLGNRVGRGSLSIQQEVRPNSVH